MTDLIMTWTIQDLVGLQHFPDYSQGSIVLTTRLSHFRRLGRGIDVEEMTPEESQVRFPSTD